MISSIPTHRWVQDTLGQRSDFRTPINCVTVLHMKSDTITVRLDEDLVPILDEVCLRSGRTRSEVMREALKRHLAQLRFEQLRRRVMPFAEARGYLTDEDVFKTVS